MVGVAHLSKDNAGILRAQREWKSHVEQKGKKLDFQYGYKLRKHDLLL